MTLVKMVPSAASVVRAIVYNEGKKKGLPTCAYLNPAQYRQRYTSLTLATWLNALCVLSHGSDRAGTVIPFKLDIIWAKLHRIETTPSYTNNAIVPLNISS